MSDPNWHRLQREYDPGARCICGHPLECHLPIDLSPCEECEDCMEFVEKDPEPDSWEPNDRDEWGRIR